MKNKVLRRFVMLRSEFFLVIIQGALDGTVKGQSRSDSLLLSPAKRFRGVVAIVAVPMRFAVIC